MYKKVSYLKQRSLLVLQVLSCLASLLEFLLSRVTPYLIFNPDAYSDFYPRLCPIPYPSRYLSHTQACYLELYLSPT
jgi:hypothetical protein